MPIVWDKTWSNIRCYDGLGFRMAKISDSDYTFCPITITFENEAFEIENESQFVVGRANTSPEHTYQALNAKVLLNIDASDSK